MPKITINYDKKCVVLHMFKFIKGMLLKVFKMLYIYAILDTIFDNWLRIFVSTFHYICVV